MGNEKDADIPEEQKTSGGVRYRLKGFLDKLGRKKDTSLRKEIERMRQELQKTEKDKTVLEQLLDQSSKDLEELLDQSSKEMDKTKSTYEKRISDLMETIYSLQETINGYERREGLWRILEGLKPQNTCTIEARKKISLAKRGGHHNAPGTEKFMYDIAGYRYVKKIKHGKSEKGQKTQITAIYDNGTIEINYCDWAEKWTTKLYVQTTANNTIETLSVALSLAFDFGIGIRESILVK